VAERQVASVKKSPDSLLGSEQRRCADKLATLQSELEKLRTQSLAFLGSSPATGVQTDLQSFIKPQVTTHHLQV